MFQYFQIHLFEVFPLVFAFAYFFLKHASICIYIFPHKSSNIHLCNNRIHNKIQHEGLLAGIEVSLGSVSRVHPLCGERIKTGAIQLRALRRQRLRPILRLHGPVHLLHLTRPSLAHMDRRKRGFIKSKVNIQISELLYN